MLSCPSRILILNLCIPSVGIGGSQRAVPQPVLAEDLVVIVSDEESIMESWAKGFENQYRGFERRVVWVIWRFWTSWSLGSVCL